MSKSVSGYYKNKKKEKKKWNGPLSHWRGEGKTLVVPPLKKTLFLCVSSLSKVYLFLGQLQIDIYHCMISFITTYIFTQYVHCTQIVHS